MWIGKERERESGGKNRILRIYFGVYGRKIRKWK